MTVPQAYPLYLANQAYHSTEQLAVHDKYSGQHIANVSMADASMIDTAIEAAVDAAPAMRRMPAHQRQSILLHCVQRFTERSDELALSLCAEAGKPIRDARGEVSRLIDTFRIAAEEATRITGEVMPMDISPRSESYTGMWKPVPIGPCSFITPFNFPLNLVAHKVALAIAAGCPFILKPASLTL